MTAGTLAVVAGFPARDEAATIGRVVATAYEGMCIAGLASMAVLVHADNITDGTVAAFLADAGKTRRLAVATGASGTGKGTNIMAIFHAALDLGAERVVVLDADVRSAEPWWTARLLEAVLVASSPIAVLVYRRNRYEGNTTSHLPSPLLVRGTGCRWPKRPGRSAAGRPV